MNKDNKSLAEKYAEFEIAMTDCTIKLAKSLGLTEIKKGEGNHGIWVHMAESLEKEVGNKCTGEFSASSPDSEWIVGFRHRFSDIVISIRNKKERRGPETYASLEFSTGWRDMENLDCDPKEDWRHYHSTGGEWKLSEIMVWNGDKGMQLLGILLDFFRKELGDKVKWSE